MNVVNHLGGSAFSLTRAILIREQGDEGQGAIASIHPIEKDAQGAAVVGAGQFLNASGLRALVRQLTPERATKFLDARVLATGVEGVMWWRRAQSTMVWFKTDANKDGIGEVHGRVPIPSLVFFSGADGWFVFAVKGKQRPSPDTPLYQAAMYNVWSDGRICVGDADVPEEHGMEEIDAYERAFFESRFTHPNVLMKSELTRYEGGAGALWKHLLAGKIKSFPERTLVPTGRTVGEWLEAMTTRTRQVRQ